MRAFHCDACGQLVFLHDDTCLRCGAALGFRPSTLEVVTLGTDDVRCATAPDSACTWLVEDEHASGRCLACRTTELVPPLDDPRTAAAYVSAERDHRWLRAQLLERGVTAAHIRLRLPSSRYDDDVVIGHADGVVTIDVEETDDARRERVRGRLGEDYRTFLGHLRHEFGHALFDTLVPEPLLPQARALFGDERDDYSAALDRHYSEGPPAGWRDSYVSSYATMHPAEDWAECFAHVLHVTDTLGSADAFGLSIDPDVAAASGVASDAEPDPERRDDGIRAALDVWLPLSYALNAVNRSMGEGMLYPFVLSEPVIDKLVFVDERIRALTQAPVVAG